MDEWTHKGTTLLLELFIAGQNIWGHKLYVKIQFYVDFRAPERPTAHYFNIGLAEQLLYFGGLAMIRLAYLFI